MSFSTTRQAIWRRHDPRRSSPCARARFSRRPRRSGSRKRRSPTSSRPFRQGQITCQRRGAGLSRSREGLQRRVATTLVTTDGAPIPAAAGTGARRRAAEVPDQDGRGRRTLLPDFDEYAGPPIEFGRMEATASDPDVQQQYGMTVGIPNAGQVNALGMINIRGERSVTCKGDFDKHPSKGPLPAGAPEVCEEFRKLPDALERAAELDAQYGRNPDLAALPMYCVPFSFKDPFDTKDMRSTGGGDARYDIDFPARDHTLVAQLRAKGAIIYAKANTTEYNGRAGDPGGRHEPDKVLRVDARLPAQHVGRQPVATRTTRRARRRSARAPGSGVSVGANLAMCSLCEETRASCRGPANHNSVALLLPQKALISFHGGAIGSDIHNDRTGIHCRSITDSAKVLDALKDPVNGYYDPRDVFTTIPRSAVLDEPYARPRRTPGTKGALKGMRIGIIRESMLTFPGVKADEPIVQAAAQGDQDDARRPPRRDAGRVDRPAVAGRSGDREHDDVLHAGARASCCRSSSPTSCYPACDAATGTAGVPGLRRGDQADRVRAGRDVRHRARWRRSTTWSALAEGKVPPPANLNIRTIQQQARVEGVPVPLRPVRDAARGRLEGARLHRDAGRLSDAERALEVLGRRPARGVQELGGDRRHPQPARRAAGHRRTLPAARAAAPRRDEGDAGEQARRGRAPAHAAAARARLASRRSRRPRATARRERLRSERRADRSADSRRATCARSTTPSSCSARTRSATSPTNNNTPTTLPAPGLPFSLVFRADPGKEDLILKVGVGLPGRVEAPRAAAGVRAAAGIADQSLAVLIPDTCATSYR